MPTASFIPPELRGDQRRLYIGKTGSGKSVKARQDLKIARLRHWRIVIVDPKRDWMKDGEQRIPYAEESKKSLGTVDRPRLVTKFDPRLAVQIFHPFQWDKQCEDFLTDVFKTGYTIIYFDEISLLVTASFVPIAFMRLWTQGRSLYIGAWCATQFPRRIPTMVMTEAEVWFIFRIIQLKDRKILADYLPVEDMPDFVEKPLPIYWFWFWEDTMIQPVLVRPIKYEGKQAA